MHDDRVTIPLEPPATRRLANDFTGVDDLIEAQKDLLWDFNEDGLPTWKKRQDESTQLTEALRRVWEERGDYSKLKIENVRRKIDENKDNPPDNPKLVDQNESDTKSSWINPEELWEMRMKMAQQLGNMAGELNTGLDLLNIVLGPLAPDAIDKDNLPIPVGGLFPTILSSEHIPSAPEPTILIDAGVSLMRKQKATQDAAKLLKRTAKELGLEAHRSQEQWNALLRLRDASWNLRPRGAKPGSDLSLIGKGSERAAREIGIAFSTTEAAEALRASSFASFQHTSPECSKTSTLSLKFPPRPRRRLCITLTFLNDHTERFSPSLSADHENPMLSFEKDLNLARAEVFEEEIFGELSRESQLTDTYRVTLSDSSVIVNNVGGCKEIRFDMLERDAASSFCDETSSYAQLLSSLTRLWMISIYRFRRNCATGPSTRAQRSQPKILKPVLDSMTFCCCSAYLRRLLSQAFTALKSTQLDVEMEFDSALESSEEILKNLIGLGPKSSATMEIGCVGTLRIGGRRSISLAVAYPACISLWLDDRSMVIGPERLTGQLEYEVIQAVSLKLKEFIGVKGINSRQVSEGVVFEKDSVELFLIPSFRLETGLKIIVEMTTKIQPRELEKLKLIKSYDGRFGLEEWSEVFKKFFLDNCSDREEKKNGNSGGDRMNVE
ncbi:subunit 17 of mediator complex-domain-containing protein [Phakopsora pachyrhizi]|nr:subunit 17 of mediator complex-domain-containing protein [Phakopsora pachyrhizi]KAI8446242.1 subunit 17 of mediator complex-domain-containing protein [Phakopsora pachyrhizi]